VSPIVPGQASLGRMHMNQPHILIVDDDPIFSELLKEVLQEQDYAISLAGNGRQALEQLQRGRPDLVLLDVTMPDMSGLQILSQVRTEHPEITVVMISGQSTIKDAVEAIKLGAYDFLEKPVDAQRVLLTVKNTLNMIRCRRERENDLRVNLERYGMIGISPAMQRAFALIDALAPTNAPVLITGESGTGKELAARALHNLSRRKNDPFVQINCAAIPDTLVESELFGYERGAFTDARQAKKGRFQLAQNGTLFLDEIGDLSLIAQSKILLALEQQEVYPLGGGKSEKLDVRFIFATNQDLEKMLAEGRFRQDLFYRINVASITLVPLRERREDIVPMAEYFLRRFEEIYPGPPKSLTDDGKSYLLSMAWEGNVRQVRNVMEKISILSNADKITARLLANILEYKGQEFNQPSPTHETLHAARENFERTYIQSILNELNGNVQQTAAVLNLNRSHLYRKLEQLGIEIGKSPSAG